ncbi:MAG: hypothetical protein K1X29_08460 [Bdellovibrionales bacterium]|nr:hypothetical protein [Bdellovibrionales bacterium]
MKALREALAQNLGKLIEQLKYNTFQIGIILGNHPKIQNTDDGERREHPEYAYLSGKLFKSPGGDSTSSTPTADNTHPLITNQTYDPFNELTLRMRGIDDQRVLDRTHVRGEAGLLSLYKATGEYLLKLRQQNFWLENAAKLVLFIADENDVCVPKKINTGSDGKTKIAGTFQTAKDKSEEIISYNDAEVCAASINGNRLTPENVYQSVIASSGSGPILFSGLLYGKDKNIPPIEGDRFPKDHGPGYGYLDVIKSNHSSYINLADILNGKLHVESLKTQLSRLGLVADASMRFPRHFFIANSKFKDSAWKNNLILNTVKIFAKKNGKDIEITNNSPGNIILTPAGELQISPEINTFSKLMSGLGSDSVEIFITYSTTTNEPVLTSP